MILEKIIEIVLTTLLKVLVKRLFKQLRAGERMKRLWKTYGNNEPRS